MHYFEKKGPFSDPFLGATHKEC